MKSPHGRQQVDIAMNNQLLPIGLLIAFIIALPGCMKPGTGHWDIHLIVVNDSGTDLEDVEIVYVDEHDMQNEQRLLLGDLPAGSEHVTRVKTTGLYWLSLGFRSGEESRTFDVAGGTITTAEEYRAIIESVDSVRLERIGIGGSVLAEGEAKPVRSVSE